MRRLSLHHLSALELDPVTLVHVAADAGFDHVCVFTEAPVGVDFKAPVIGPDNAPAVLRAMRDRSVSAYNIEIFWLGANTRVADFRSSLERGAALGGKRATCIVTEDDDALAAELFAAFSEVAEEFGIAAGLEFMAFSPTRTLENAHGVVRRAAHPNGSIVVDMLHLVRNGGSAADLVALEPDLIGYVQLCDGLLTAPTDPWDEAIANRMIPGQGAFPLRDILAAIPGNRTLALEVPLHRLREAGMDAAVRAQCLFEATRKLLG